jgi:hypothetical protein
MCWGSFVLGVTLGLVGGVVWLVGLWVVWLCEWWTRRGF